MHRPFQWIGFFVAVLLASAVPPSVFAEEDQQIPYFRFSGSGLYQTSQILYCETEVNNDGTCARPSSQPPFSVSTAEAAWALANGGLPSNQLCFRYLKGYMSNGADPRRGFRRSFGTTFSRSSNAFIGIGCTHEEIRNLKTFLNENPLMDDSQKQNFCSEASSTPDNLSEATQTR